MAEGDEPMEELVRFVCDPFKLEHGKPLGDNQAVETYLEQLERVEFLPCIAQSAKMRGQEEGLLERLEDRFLYFKDPTGKFMWMCVNCPWTSKYKGCQRAVEHMCFSHVVKEQEYKKLHDIVEVDAPMKKVIAKYRDAGSNTAPCKDPLGKDEILAFARKGNATAFLVAKFNRWLAPEMAKSQVSQHLQIAPEPPTHNLFDQNKAEVFHIIAIANQALSFHGAVNPEWSRFLTYISGGQYAIPSRARIFVVARELDSRIEARKTDLYGERGPWSLGHDGATSGHAQYLCLKLSR
mmetsp:Transcript_82544/g.129952  ORF Transcript_82544/g.129952 Transcript_82544/m.129952 type:complete len:294 (+) Transcript_82544:54-935(+)